MESPKKKTFRVVTLGCRTNQYESQAYQNQLIAMGYVPALDGESAEICIVNSCTVTESADSHSRHAIRQLAKENPHSKLVVTGCFADRQPEIVAGFEGVTEVVLNKDKENLLERIFPNEDLPEFVINHFDAHTRAFVKIQDGCNSFCTYCVIPYVRGRSRSRTASEIITEIESLIKNGYREVVLTGINIGDYDGGKEPCRLADLIRAVDKIQGLDRLRVSSIDPDEVDDDLMDAILNGKKTCHSMHVVLQSGSNVILKKMNRKYTRQIFFDTVERLKKASPDFTFTTDVIVGFPGETEVDFRETIQVIEEVEFAKVHMFPYSDRPRTRSALMPGKVSPAEIKIRKNEVLRVAEQASYRLRDRFLGRKMSILIEGGDSSNPNQLSGHTSNFLNVWIPKGDFKPNQIVEVHLIKNAAEGLSGHPI